MIAAALRLLSTALPLVSPSSPPEERGVALGLFSMDPAFDYQPLIEEIAELGATDLSLSWVWWQQDLHSEVIGPMPGWSPTDDQIRAAMRTARSLGLRLTLFPILRLVEAKKSEWRGQIAPRDEDRWWESYQAFILHAAGLAAELHAERLSVGSEMISREGMRDRWIELIDRVHLRAPESELLYSANWDHYALVRFWDRVDVVGLSAYFELEGEEEQALVAAWSPIKRRLERFSRALGKPLLITEIGYPSQTGSARFPWDQTRTETVDLEEQRRATAAFIRAWSGTPFLLGVVWWNWFGFGGPQDAGYTPRQKPAAELIRRWYSTR